MLIARFVNSVVPFVFLICSSSFGATGLPSVPYPAINVGYLINTFNSNFSKKNSPSSCYKYGELTPFRFFNYAYDNSMDVVSDDGVLKLNGSSRYANAHLATFSLIDGKLSGVAFGGGAYFEAELRFDPDKVKPQQGWPAFWALPIEGAAKIGTGGQWEGMPAGFLNNVELDFFEYMFSGASFYSGTIHNWYGEKGRSCSSGFCRFSTPTEDNKRSYPNNTNIKSFNKYGFLWVPATKDSLGYAKFYFNDIEVGPPVFWKLWKPDVDKETFVSFSWAFSAMDYSKYFLIIGSGEAQDFEVRSIRVWQSDAKSNLILNICNSKW